MDKPKVYPKIAILLPVYNGENFLERQIRSILAQKKSFIDIYLSLDKSTDRSSEICEEFQKKNHNIFFINKNKNEIFGSAAQNFFNLFLSVNFEKYDYISLSDQDDIWKPFKLSNGYKILISGKFHGYSSNVRPFYKKKLLRIVDKSYPQTKYDYFFEGGGAGNTYIITKNVALSFQNFLKTNINEIKKINHHDWLLYAYTRSHHGSWYIDKSVNVFYRQHHKNELGTNFSFYGFIRRLSTVLNGYAISQARLVKNVLKVNDNLLSKIFKKNFFAGCYQMIYFYKFRRSPLGKIAFIFVGLVNLFRMNN